MYEPPDRCPLYSESLSSSSLPSMSALRSVVKSQRFLFIRKNMMVSKLRGSRLDRKGDKTSLH